MLKAVLIVGFVVILLIGGLMTLRNSAKTGIPDESTLQRAQKRAREQDAEHGED
jgi:hypothetical protein